MKVLSSEASARVIPLLVLIHKLSKKTSVIVTCKIIIGIATIKSPR